ncbi:MAG: DEAD/DEAH box helicase family protein [Desulfobacteraceae bacterium]|nr:DEAD/DEAH box helicase family protein [Desulfobacteraceae bacterium]
MLFYLFQTNSGIESFEDLVYEILNNEHDGAENLNSFSHKLRESGIIRKYISPAMLGKSEKVQIVGNEILLNGEAFSVFKSWESGQKIYVQKHLERLTRLLAGGNRQFRVCAIPEVAKEAFVNLRSSISRPYSLPFEKNTTIDNHPEAFHCPVRLYPFQEKAIHFWTERNYRGIFEMATGTGKTFTSLAAAVSRINVLGKLSLIILVPYLHLLEQWQKRCEEFGFLPVLCSSEHRGWQQEVLSKIQDFNFGALETVCIIAVHDTAASEKFRKAVKRLPADYTMIIGDEVHALGSMTKRQAMLSTSAKVLHHNLYSVP